jgi:uroporphyrin-III C-methyltransferase
VSKIIKRGILVVGHGSRRAEANDDLRRVAHRIAKDGGFEHVVAAFLEIESPSIGEGFGELVSAGVTDITVLPYFLSPGRHTRGDLPIEVERAASSYSSVTYRIAEPLSGHRLIIDASIERINDANNRTQIEEGVVYLVGAGPGDPGLLTIKARDLLSTCDAIVYDYLVNPKILQLAPARAERFYVGKIGGGDQTSQDYINGLLIDLASAGKKIVRLKGGDPFIFGRGAEEAEVLRSSGVRFEVVPGVSSALAVPAYAGIPLTHREISSSVAILTGVKVRDEEYAETLSRISSADTLVVLMGRTRLREICEILISSGRAKETPVAVIRWGTYELQQTITGTLATITTEFERRGLGTPAVIVIGEVVRLREKLSWYAESFAELDESQFVAAIGKIG